MSVPSDYRSLDALNWPLLRGLRFDHGGPVDDFIQRRALDDKRELLRQTWVKFAPASLEPIGFVSFSNSSIPAADSDKAFSGLDYPAVLLAFIGVREELRGMGLGSAMLAEWLSSFASVNNKTGCRIMKVYPTSIDLAEGFYKKLGFHYIGKRPHIDQVSIAMFVPLTRYRSIKLSQGTNPHGQAD